jgi:hypothetical protein
LKWEGSFRPDEVKETSPVVRGNGFRLIDANEKYATLMTSAPIEPSIENGKLVIQVAMPDRDTQDFGAVTGQVLDENDRPIPGVFVALAANSWFISDELRHHATTNALGQYRLGDIPRRRIDGKPSDFQIVAAKERFAGFVSPPLTFKDDTIGKFQIVDPIRLKPGAAISGIVVDHRGQPVSGARVRSDKPVPHSGLSASLQMVRTDEHGRFTMHDLRRGMTTLSADHGMLLTSWKQVLVESSSVLLQLPEERRGSNVSLKSQARPDPLQPGQGAVEWQTEPWSDGHRHKLADDCGNPIVLYFWGTDFWQSVGALPAFSNLAAEFERRGVVFRAIHPTFRTSAS